MEDIIPSYLTKDFLKRALEKGLETPNIEIENFTVSNASGTGENYTSELYRVSVNYKLSQTISHEISLILKNILPNVDEGTFNHVDVVTNEIITYTKIIPEIEKLLGNSTMITPKCFAADQETQVLVLDDLSALGYKLQNRVTGLDEEHCILVMKKIAQYHAGSMQIAKSNPKYLDIFNRPIFNEFTTESDYLSQLTIFYFEKIISVVKAWPGFEEIVTKLEKISKDITKICIEHCKRKEGELLVLTHGDLWVNNIMFKYNQGNKKPTDVAFIDLQFSYYGSLGIDVNFFLNSSATLEILKSKRAELLEVYYETLKATLEQIKYSPIPSWEAVSKEIREKEFYGLAIACTALPVITLDKSASENSTLDNLLEDSPEKLNSLFGSERVIKTLKYSLKRFDELGVLDELDILKYK